MKLNTSVENLRYVGQKYSKKLNKLGIKTIEHLLWHFPIRYEDWSEQTTVEEIKPGQKVSIIGKIVSIENKRSFRRRMILTTASVEDKTGKINAIWYNQPFLAARLKPGLTISLSGNVKLDRYGLYFQNPGYEVIRDSRITKLDSHNQLKLKHTGRLVPVYPETEGLTSRYLRFLIKPLLKLTQRIPDFLPEEVIKRQNLFDIKTAFNEIHFPTSLENAEKAKKRFAFEELFLLQLKALSERKKIQQQKSYQVSFNKDLIKSFVDSLPFQLTDSQRIALWEIIQDLQRPFPMNRLLNGDVGSGKTLVAVASALEVAKAGYQVAVMAPTEVLANQHFKTFVNFLKNYDVRIGLLTSSGVKEENVFKEEKIKRGLRKKFLEKISKGEVDIVIGTHSLIQKNVCFDKLALVVIDEQHRFGIEQRATLLRGNGGKLNGYIPHLLSMTATPIPRTLALTIYGDLDISLLKEMPKGRKPIETRLITLDEKEKAYEFIRKQVKKDRQVFVVCPRIEVSGQKSANDSESAVSIKKDIKQLSLKKYLQYEVKAVKTEYEKLSKGVFPDLKVAMLHGKMKPKEKEAIMTRFKEGNINILVSTSVIEVGVDVPNATIMMIEGAERFGLAQLHQFRGRIGRGEHKSYCFLFVESPLIETTRRLNALLEHNNGFKLAEMDLKIRGPGEFTGLKQSGIPDLTMASLADMDLIKKSRQEAKLILKNIHKYPLVLQKLNEFKSEIHFE